MEMAVVVHAPHMWKPDKYWVVESVFVSCAVFEPTKSTTNY